jgi:hypothetical protein
MVPQSSEGSQVLSQSITPLAAANKLLVTVVLNVASNTGLDGVVAALFKDSDTSALAAAFYMVTENRSGSTALVIRYEMAAGGTSPITFKVRMGPGSAGNAYLNGHNGARVLGGALISSITIEELKV